MRKQAKATFGIKSWDEKTYNEIDEGPKLTRASVTKSYQGDVDGEGKLEYLMMYRTAGSASFMGLERLTGSASGRAGSFVLQHSGTFEDGVAKVTLSVVRGSGTGDPRRAPSTVCLSGRHTHRRVSLQQIRCGYQGRRGRHTEWPDCRGRSEKQSQNSHPRAND